ncbi:MAG: metal-dependent hydrolase [Gammaproteobacteria bacterium]|nr:metal-dependent hydrolase [Gammaproteobacteria bacterium]
MVGRTHIAFGLATLAGVDAVTGLTQPHLVKGIPIGPVLCVVAAVLGSLIPDLDAEEGSMLQYELGEAGMMFSGWLQSFTEHRGLTHYGVTALVITLVSTALGWWFGFWDVGLSFGLGYGSHVLADGMTLAGVPLFGPWQQEKVHILPRSVRIRTGGPVEPLVFVIVTVVFLVLSPALLPGEFFELLKDLRALV